MCRVSCLVFSKQRNFEMVLNTGIRRTSSNCFERPVQKFCQLTLTTSLKSSNNWYCLLTQVCFSSTIPEFATTVPRIRIKKDRPLDLVAEQEKSIAPILRIRDMFLRFKKDEIPLRYLTIKRKILGLRTTEEKFEDFIRDYPNMFDVFTHPDEQLPWLKLTPQLNDLIEEERLIHQREEQPIVERLKRLLMLAQNQQLRANRIVMAAAFFGFPNDIITRIVPKYHDCFNLAQNGKPYQTLELVSWDESLAIAEFEKKARANGERSGLGNIKTRGIPLSFKTQYSLGVMPRKKSLEYLERWQRLPYVSPYEEYPDLEEGTPLADRRMVALLHEILSLTIQKKITIEILNHFQKEFKLPANLYKAVNRYPGIFYISVIGAVHTLYLREAYQKQQLIECDHPLISLKEKYYKLVKNGPRLRSMLANANRNAKCRL